MAKKGTGFVCIRSRGGRKQCAKRLSNGKMKFVKNSTVGCTCK